jgi:superfamily II DNA or RNA helicase
VSDYKKFLDSKRVKVESAGYDVSESDINPMLFDWQKAVVKWALKRGRAALFQDCGLGKTFQQIEWARNVSSHTGGNVLILTPLAVAPQTVREGKKLGIDITICKDSSDIKSGLNVANYERLHLFDSSAFSGIVLDESSILKSFDGSTRNMIQEFSKKINYRLACTATPAPNDLIELTNHAEFLDIMSGKEIIALFFKQDGNTTHKWRLKNHARDAFWSWMAKWSIAIRKPSDIGYDDGNFRLPELNMHHVTVHGKPTEGFLFAVEAQTLQERRAARRASMEDRVAVAAGLVNGNDEKWLVWCDMNDESRMLTKAIPGAVEVTGSDSPEYKESALNDFAQGKIRVMVSKPSIAGFGMNFQICHNMVFVGLSDSYESFYQAVRRCWRFGQLNEVNCYVVSAETEGAVVSNISRKEKQASQMFDEIVRKMNIHELSKQQKRNEMEYNPSVEMIVPKWLKGVEL